MYRRSLFLAATCGLLVAAPAFAAKGKLSLYLGPPTGQAIDIQSFSWGVSNSGSAHAGGGAGAGKANFSDISVSKVVDGNSAELLKDAATGAHIQKASVQWVAGPFAVAYCLQDVLVSSVQQSGSTGDDALQESVSLNFGKVLFKAGSASFNYDLAGQAENNDNLCA